MSKKPLTRDISIHSLVKRETCQTDTVRREKLSDFNPLPRKEGDDKEDNYLSFLDAISIHSLVKRETQRKNLYNKNEVISIHSLVKRETA